MEWVDKRIVLLLSRAKRCTKASHSCTADSNYAALASRSLNTARSHCRQLQFDVNTSFDVDMYDVDLFGKIRRDLAACVKHNRCCSMSATSGDLCCFKYRSRRCLCRHDTTRDAICSDHLANSPIARLLCVSRSVAQPKPCCRDVLGSDAGWSPSARPCGLFVDCRHRLQLIMSDVGHAPLWTRRLNAFFPWAP